MKTMNMPIEAAMANWDKLAFGTLPDSFKTHKHELIWVIDTRKKIILANGAYIRFVYELTGELIHIYDDVLPPMTDANMTAKWDNLYTRALRGEKFNVITNYMTTGEPVIIDTSFIPIIDSDHIMGTACVARNSNMSKSSI